MLTELLQNWMNSKRCYVTGASGALGSEICIALHSLIDLEVVPLRRNENNTYIPNLQLRNQDGNRAPKFLFTAVGILEIERSLRNRIQRLRHWRLRNIVKSTKSK